jgi:hypothetical protein
MLKGLALVLLVILPTLPLRCRLRISMQERTLFWSMERRASSPAGLFDFGIMPERSERETRDRTTRRSVAKLRNLSSPRYTQQAGG